MKTMSAAEFNASAAKPKRSKYGNKPVTIDGGMVREWLSYDAETGIFTWAKSPGGTSVGAVAGHLGNNGYIQIRIAYQSFLAHRLSWLWMTDEWPPAQVDHVNRDRSDNRWSNLRLANPSENAANGGLRTTNSSGVKGVHWFARDGKWQAQITVNGKKFHLGYYSDIQEAAESYAAACKRHFGDFGRSERKSEAA